MLGDLRDGGQVRHGSTERQEVVSGLSLQSGLEDETGCSTAAVLVEEVLKRREEQFVMVQKLVLSTKGWTKVQQPLNCTSAASRGQSGRVHHR